MLAYLCEIDFACIYAIRSPTLARQCASKALVEAIRMRRPDLAYRANTLLGAL